MTIREFYQTVLDAHISEDMDKASAELIKKLDDRNEKRKSADSKAKRETADRRTAVLNFLSTNEGVFTRGDIALATGLSAGQVTAACKVLIDDGKVVKSEVKVDKTKKIGYSIA